MMIRPAYISAALVLGLAATAFAEDKNPPIRSIDRTCLPAGAPRPTVPLYTSDLAEHYTEIAVVDSYVSMDKCDDTTRMQLKDLQAKGAAIHADALIRVRPLSKKVTGWHENKDTPFLSFKQDTTGDHFYRATAIKYLRWPKAEPKPLDIPKNNAPVAKEVSPLIDTNSLLKVKRPRSNRNEVSVPEVYTTQQPSQGTN